MASSAFIWGLGDITAQRLEAREAAAAAAPAPGDDEDNAVGLPPPATHLFGSLPVFPDVQWRRTAIQIFYASCCWTPVATAWYRGLDRAALAWSGGAAGSARFVAAKLAAEVAVFHPVSLAFFFGCMGAARGDAPAAVLTKARADFPSTLAFEIALWTPLDAALFAVVPVRYQLLAVDCGCFLESIALSWVNVNGAALPAWLREGEADSAAPAAAAREVGGLVTATGEKALGYLGPGL